MELAVRSPVGVVLLRADGQAITGVHLAGDVECPRRRGEPSPLLAEAAAQLAAYFAGKLKAFDLPLAPKGNAYQLRVWQAIRGIPCGQTRSYGDIAFATGSGPRAVGGACGRNPIALIIPCHRVLAAHGRLGGYSAAKGLITKKFLLEREGAWPVATAA